MSIDEPKLLAKIAMLPADEILVKLDLDTHKQGDNVRIRCYNKEGHKNGDANPSMSVHIASHKYHCFACGAGGSDILSLLGHTFKRKRTSLLEFLCHRLFHSVVPESAIDDYHNRLITSEAATEHLDHLVKHRGIVRRVIDTFRVGVDESGRITIPIDGPFGLVCDLRRWDALRKDTRPKAPKFLPYAETGYGDRSHGSIWPLNVLATNDSLLLCEGEGDTLRSLSANVAAVTFIGGTGVFANNPTLSKAFCAKSLSICLDNDEAGKKATTSILENIKSTDVARYRIISFPTRYKDLTEWLHDAGDDALTKALETTAWLDPKDSHAKNVEIQIPLSNIVSPEAVRTNITFIGQVASVAMQPSLVPKKFRVTCAGDQGESCHTCPNNKRGLNGLYDVLLEDDTYVDCLEQTDLFVLRRLARHAGIPKVCCRCINIVETHPALEAKLIPGAHRPGRDVTTEHVTRDVIYAGHYLMAGQTSKFKGYTRPHPKTQKAITIITEMASGVRAWDGFEIPDYLASELRFVYHNKHPYDALYWSADQLGAYYTRVAGRALLHVVSDIVFHSLLEIPVGGKLHNGFMDVLIIGESTTGKGMTVEGMVNTYGAGEVISGKRCTVAGLIGGTLRHSGGFDLSVGAWALRDGEIVVMDEKTPPDVFSTLTRPRREGVAEFTQAGITHRAMARVRKIWIQNPPAGRIFSDYRFGIEVLRDLVPATEDIARWDLVVGVLADVTDKAVAQALMPLKTKPLLSRDMLRAKLMWAWSRRHENVNFHKSAREAVERFTSVVNEKYADPRIGLIQPGATSIKLRKGAAAVAAAVFSTTEHDSKMLHVTGDHVEAFVKVMNDALDAPALRMSELCKLNRNKNIDLLVDSLRKLVKATKDKDFVGNLLRQAPSNRRTWEALVPVTVNGVAFVDEMIRSHGLVSEDRGNTLRLSSPAAKILEKLVTDNNSVKTAIVKQLVN